MNIRFRTAEVHRPFIDLLDRVAVSASGDPYTYRRIRLHLQPLRQWFAEHTGWPIIANRELVRLVKSPAVASSGLGFRWAQAPIDYELMTWVLWYGERTGAEQFLLSDLVEEIAAQASVSVAPGHIDWNLYHHRQGLRRALDALEQMGALSRMDGSMEEWAATRVGNTLYEFTSLARHIGVESTDVNAAPATVAPEHRLYRTLLMSPALYAARDPEAFELLRTKERRQKVVAELRNHFGWDLEVTSSYACVLRSAASEVSEQSRFPFRAVIVHPMLLLCGVLRGRVARGEHHPDDQDRLALSPAFVETELADLSRQHSGNWGSTLGDLPLARLTDQVIGAMRDWELLEGPDQDGLLHVLPLAARFAAVYGVDDEGL